MRRILLFAFLCVVSAATSYADVPAVEFGGKFYVQSIYEDNRDLGTRDTTPGRSLAFDFQPDMKLFLNDNITGYVRGRLVKTLGDDGVEDDNGQISSSEQFLELREAWVDFEHIGGVYPLSFKLGHQRIREDRSLFWNDDVDAALLSYDTTLFSGFFGVVNNFASYRTSEDDYLEDDEERLRILTEGSWLYAPNHQIELRGLYENDYSGTENIGQLVVSDNRDDEDYNLLWLGVRSAGSFAPAKSFLSNIKYRADLIGVIGEETVQATATTANATFRSVTGQSDNDVLGWALDAGVDFAINMPGKPVLTLNYAYGSGDDDSTDGTNNAYRDTDMNGNTSRFGLSSQNLHNYGEVFRPDLVNMHVLTAGIGAPVLKEGDVSIFYHHYIQDEKLGNIGSNRLQARVNNTSTDIGSEFNVAFNVDLQKQFKNSLSLPDKTRLRISTGVFLPGKAFEAVGANGNSVWRGLMQINFKF